MDETQHRAPTSTVPIRARLRACAAAVGSVGVHLAVASTLMTGELPGARAVPAVGPLEMLEFEAAPPPPSAPEEPDEPSSDAPALTEPVSSRDEGLRVARTRAMPHLALSHPGARRGPFDFVERLDVGRYTPRTTPSPTASGTPPTTGSSETESSSRDATPESESAPETPSEVAAAGPESEAPALTAELEVAVDAPDDAPAEPREDVAETALPAPPSAEPRAIGRGDLVALRSLGDVGSLSRSLGGLGVDLLPLLGLAPADVARSADVRGGELARGRSVALSTQLDSDALRERVEGAANSRGVTLTFTDEPIGNSTQLELEGRTLTLSLQGSHLTVASRPSARLLRASLDALASAPELEGSLASSERSGDEISLVPRPARLSAALRVDTERNASLEFLLEFASGDEAMEVVNAEEELRRALLSSFGLPDETSTDFAPPRVVGTSVRVGVAIAPEQVLPISLRLARGD